MEKLKAKKSLGQNFLKDEGTIKRIIEAADLSLKDAIVEIGPGQGALTEKLAQKCGKVVAIELDERLIEPLRNKLRDFKNIKIIHGDILKINLPELVMANNLGQMSYKVIANIPYYITAPIIRLLLETRYPPQEMILMVQKEVAQRITAKPGEMSILAVSVQYYAKAEILFEVPRRFFDPVPQVDSAVIKIAVGHEPSVTDKEKTRKFFKIIRAGFSAKRKTLANNLAASLQLDKKEIEQKIESLGFSRNARAQELSVDDWKSLAGML